MGKYLFIKALSKGPAKGAPDVAIAVSKGVRTTKILADGTKITMSATKITSKALKGTGEIGAKSVTILKAKLKDAKSLLKKNKFKAKNLSSTSEGFEEFGEGFLTKGDVYDNIFEKGFKDAFGSPSFGNLTTKASQGLKPVSKQATEVGKKIVETRADLTGRVTYNLNNAAVELYKKSTTIRPQIGKKLDFGI